MIKRVTRERTNQQIELTADEMECVSGGLLSVINEQVVVHYHAPVTPSGTTMYRPPSKKRA
jgi:hypothetical protein